MTYAPYGYQVRCDVGILEYGSRRLWDQEAYTDKIQMGCIPKNGSYEQVYGMAGEEAT